MANETKTQGTLKVLAAGQHLERAAIAADGSVNVHHGKAQLQSVDVADVDLLLSFADGSYVVIPNGALDAISGTAHAVTFSDSKEALGDLFKQAGTTAAAKAGSLRLVSENIDAAQPPADETTTQEQAPTIEPPAPPAPLVKVGAGIAAGAAVGASNALGHGAGTGASAGDVSTPVQAVQIAEPPVYKSGHTQTPVYTTGTQQEAVEVAAPNLFDSLSSPPTVSVALFTSSSFKLTGATGTPAGAWIAPPPTLSTDPAYSADRAVYAEQLAIRSAPGAQASRATITGTSAADSIIHNSAFSTTASQWVMNLHVDTTNFNTITKIVITVNGAYTSIPGFDIQGAGVTHIAGTNQWVVDPAAVADLLTNGLNLSIVYNVSDDAAYLASAATVLSSSVTVSGTHTENGATVTPDVTTSFQMVSSNAVSQADYTVAVTDPTYGTNMLVLPRSGVGYDIYAGAGDDVVHSGAGADMIKGEAGSDTLDGGSGNDVLNGGLGADTLIGGAGIDAATYADASVGITAALDGSLVGLAGSESYGDTFASIENLTGTAYADTLVGNSVDNVLTGGGGDDILEGRGGADTLNGGDGNDTASYAHSINGVSVSLLTGTGGGASTSESFGDTLISIENLIGSSFDDVLVGDGNANILDGGAGDDTLTGGGGADTLIGGDGIDTASYASATTGVTASLTGTFLAGPAVTPSGDAAGDSYSSIENLSGSAFNDQLIGDGNGNTLAGGAGNDTLEGMGGADILQGGDGSDTASYEHATAAVRASLINSTSNTGADAAGDAYVSIENLSGSGFDDTLVGDDGVNVLAGGAGDDLLEGFGGADALDGGTGNNTATYADSAMIRGSNNEALGVTASLAAPGSNTGDAHGDTYTNIQNLIGSDYNDTLTGDANANTLSGGQGDDILEGLGGADVLNGGNGIDTASYASAGTAIVASLSDASTNTGTDALGDTYSSIENLTGGTGADTLIGDADSNVLDGGAGNDVLEGMAGADTLTGGAGSNTASFAHAGLASYALTTTAFGLGVTASLTDGITQSGDALGDSYSGIANLIGSDYADTLIGDTAANTIYGGASNDTLEGMGGADALDGGAGSNTASYAHADGGVLASLDISYGVNTGDAAGDTYANIANLTGSNHNDTLIGDGGINTLSGGDGDDVLEGQAGADVLDGGNGNNTASYAHASAGIFASLVSPSSNSGDASGDTFIQIQNLTGSALNDTLTGDTVSNILDGGAGNDLLDGGAGLTGDAFIGGAGTDTVTYANATYGVTATLTTVFAAGAAVVEAGDATNDTFDGVENLTGSASADILVGDGGVNTLEGGGGDDILEGMAGADVLDGGDTIAGYNTASYAHASVGVLASLETGYVTNTGDAAGDTYVNISNLTGSNDNDTLIGNANNNTLSGGTGDDVLEGRFGADVLDGGNGTDTATYVHSALGVTVALNAGLGVTQTNDALGDTYVSIENIHGSTLADTLIGTTANNTLWGDTGNDTLEGGAGADVLYGGIGSNPTTYVGDGNDTASYAHASAAVTASLTLSLVASTLAVGGDAFGDTYFSIENLTGSAFGDTLIGNTASNLLSGGAGDDTLEGIGGGDSYDGGTYTAGNTVTYLHASVQADGLSGVTASLASQAGNLGAAYGDTYASIQNLTGSNFNDTLTGDGNANTLTGGEGNDTLSGGAGTDKLYGGNGNDTLSDDGIGGAILDGGAGNDTITVTAGSLSDTTSDTFTGGTGVDTLVWSGSTTLTVNLVNGALTGVSGALDAYNVSGAGFENVTASGTNSLYIVMSNASNIITGSAGNDSVDFANALSAVTASLTTQTISYASTGNGTDAMSGIDNLYGSANADTLTGNTGNNILSGGAGADTLSGLAGNDTLYGGAGMDTINGGDDNDTIYGGSEADAITGGLGTDYARYDGTGDSATVNVSLLDATTSGLLGFVASGSAFGDTFTGIEGLYGTSGADILWGDGGINTLNGQGGDDTLEGFNGGDTFDGGTYLTAGNTVSFAHSGNPTLYLAGATFGDGVGVTATLTTTLGITNTGDAASDTYTNIQNLTGSDYNDTLVGDWQINAINGGLGDDTLEGLGLGDSFTGGGYSSGGDTVTYAHSALGVVANLANPLGNTNDAAGDTYTNIQNLTGSALADTLTGDANNNVLHGGAGDDAINALLGHDSAYGDAGNDTIRVATGGADQPLLVDGGAGSDTLALNGLSTGTYSFTPLAQLTSNMEILTIRSDSANTALTLTSADVQHFVSNGAASTITINADTGDSLVISPVAGETVTPTGTVNDMTYTISDTTTHAQIAQVHWLAA